MGITRPKRRAGRKKVRQHPRKEYRKLNNTDAKIQAKWDPKKSWLQNYKALGLSQGFQLKRTPQLIIEEAVLEDPDEDQKEEEEEVEEEIQTEESEEPGVFEELFPKPPPRPKREKTLTISERHYYKRLIDKYGDNYKAMARDIKLNNYQQTENKCRKKCQLYLEKYANTDKK